MKTKIKSLFVATVVLSAATPAFASAVAVPEPGSLSLLALGAVGAVVGVRFWRNK